MKLNIEVWRQKSRYETGRFESHEMEDLEPHMSVLELLDALNERLVDSGEEAVTFESDCREGICGACGITVDGRPHGPDENVPSCHQRLLNFRDGATVRLEPFRSGSFPVIRDLMVDRDRLDDVIRAGGYVSINAGTAPDADTIPIPEDVAETSLDFAACIGCGACVAACPNGSAHLFGGAKIQHLAMLPLSAQERTRRARTLVDELEASFGPCSNYGECAKVCPAGIPLTAIAAVNRERLRAGFQRRF